MVIVCSIRFKLNPPPHTQVVRDIFSLHLFIYRSRYTAVLNTLAAPILRTSREGHIITILIAKGIFSIFY